MTRPSSAMTLAPATSALSVLLATGMPRPAAAGAGVQATGRADPTAALADTVQLSPEARAKHVAAQETLGKLQQATASMATDRKAAAKQKLDQAKAKLQMLRMFSGDPKAMARQARQIAQEIREAARDYGAAAASEAPAEATPSDQAPGTAAGQTGAETASDARNPQGEDKASASPAPDPAKTGEAGKAPDAGSAGTERPPTDEERRQQVADAYRAAAHDIASRGAKAQADREDIEQFKDAARQARQLLQEAARRLKQEKADPAEIDEIEKASRSMTHEVDELSAPDATSAEPGAMPVLDLLA
ncbi:hypothetical protein [Phreatobacter sp.]|uniref:hypothetical protein n=1 Tax=Phreatobacter sp. TaxID=1966341 RepID=UPI0022BF8A83|nr:hypothetical protein [Phreatobacter sp.]MCZ8315878.1 hypothetical protein [Phreatobacter sp.]